MPHRGHRLGLRLSTLACATALVAGLVVASDAWALALGRATVQSALGEPLRAEIDVPSITSEEAASLSLRIADADAFRAAGMELNTLLTDVQFNVVRRADGRTTIRLQSSRPVSEPFLDLIVQADWSAGRMVRGYTMLFDPPGLRATQPPAPLLPNASVPAPAPRPTTPAAQPAPAAAVDSPAPAPARAPSPPPPPRTQAPAPAPAPAASPAGNRVEVRSGDTAGRIAAAHKPPQVSLDQMLVALLQNNPNAFIGGNVNRMRAGVVLNLPDEQQAAAVDAASARRTIAAQSQDFNEFRRRLAGAVPNAPTGTPGRESSGQVQTEVQDKRPAAPAPDRLTLSKGAVTGKEASIADQRARQDNSTRTAELSRNIEELSKLQQGTQAASAPPSPAPAPAPVAEPTPPVGPAVTAPAPAAPPAAPAAEPPKPEASPPPAKPPAPPAPEEPGLLQSLLDNPLALPAGGGLIALLGVLALLKRRRDKAPAQAEDGTPGGESFFNASGGHQVDTEEAPAGAASSMMYSPSQLDAAGDVDPVAEADVYLAYGRDAQAEEILREAARLHPERIAVHGKLLEIYAKRGDKAAMEAVASEIYALSGGAGDDWEHACRVAHPVDPDNPLYRLQGASARPQPTVSMPLEASEPEGEVASAPADTDSGLDLDLSFDDPAAQAPAAADGGLPALELPTVAELSAAATPDAPPAAEPPPADDGFAVDFDLDLSPPPADPPPPAAAPAADEDMGLDFELDLGENVASAAEPAPADVTTGTEVQSMDLDTFNALANEAPAPAPAAPAMDLADFNLDLDLGTPAAAASTSLPDIADPLETKLSLAEEFQAIGDTEGARSLAEEVRDEASGELKARAEAFLSSLT